MEVLLALFQRLGSLTALSLRHFPSLVSRRGLLLLRSVLYTLARVTTGRRPHVCRPSRYPGVGLELVLAWRGIWGQILTSKCRVDIELFKSQSGGIAHAEASR